jgi:hypothetical protein
MFNPKHTKNGAHKIEWKTKTDSLVRTVFSNDNYTTQFSKESREFVDQAVKKDWPFFFGMGCFTVIIMVIPIVYLLTKIFF